MDRVDQTITYVFDHRGIVLSVFGAKLAIGPGVTDADCERASDFVRAARAGLRQWLAAPAVEAGEADGGLFGFHKDGPCV